MPIARLRLLTNPGCRPTLEVMIAVITDGSNYKKVPIRPGANAEVILADCPDFMTVGTADSPEGADRIIARDRARRTTQVC